MKWSNLQEKFSKIKKKFLHRIGSVVNLTELLEINLLSSRKLDHFKALVKILFWIQNDLAYKME
jgi:hypothetical protein